jgi:hypothetical protein
MDDESQQRKKALDDFLSTFAQQRREYVITNQEIGPTFRPPGAGDGNEWQFQAFQSTTTVGNTYILWSRIRTS